MLFDLANDIHVDLWAGGVLAIDWEEMKNPGSDVLIVSGDTSNHVDEVYFVIKDAADYYEHVIFTDGNHEHYFHKGTVDDLERMFRVDFENNKKVTYLDGLTNIRIDDTLFVGANGWYDFRAREPGIPYLKCKTNWAKKMNDNRMIHFDGVLPDLRAENHAKILAKVVDSQQKHDELDIVVVTHTAPHRNLVGLGRFDDSLLDGAFCNTQMSLVREADKNNKIKIWCYGHTHVRDDRTIDGIRYVNNCRGYESERWAMGKWFIAQIDTEDLGYAALEEGKKDG